MIQQPPEKGSPVIHTDPPLLTQVIKPMINEKPIGKTELVNSLALGHDLADTPFESGLSPSALSTLFHMNIHILENLIIIQSSMYHKESDLNR